MDYPFGHPNHRPHHHHRRDEDEYPPPPSRPQPPPFYDAPPPPHVAHVSHYGGEPNYYPPPPPPHVVHVSHRGGEPNYYAPPPPQPFPHAPPTQPSYPPPPTYENNPHHDHHHHHHHPHMPAFIENHTHHNLPDSITQKRSCRVYSKAEPNYSLSIRDGKVILTRSDPSDPYQHWIKDEKWSTKVKDEQGYPSFALVNKATGLAMKHSVGATYPVQLTQYNSDLLDESVLWTESKDLGDGYRTIRMINNIKLNVDALNGDKNHGGVHEGTTIVLWEWKKGENQRWKIVPY